MRWKALVKTFPVVHCSSFQLRYSSRNLAYCLDLWLPSPFQVPKEISGQGHFSPARLTVTGCSSCGLLPFFSFKVVKAERYQRCIVHLSFYLLILLLQVLRLKSSWALCNNNPTGIWQVALVRPFAFVCKPPPKVNLDYQRLKVHILGQLNCWQVW